MRLVGTSGDHLVQPPDPKQLQREKVTQGGVWSHFECLQGCRLSSLFQSLTQIFYFSGHHWEESGRIFFAPSITYLKHFDKVPSWAFSLLGWKAPALSLQVLFNCHFILSLKTLQEVSVSCSGSPALVTAIQMSQQCWAEDKSTSLNMLPALCLMQIRRLCLPSLLWGCVSDSQSVLCPPGFLGPFPQSFFPTGWPCWSFLGLFPSQEENFALPFTGLFEISFRSLIHLLKVSLNGSRSLWWHQPFLPGFYHVWSCAGSTLSYHLGINGYCITSNQWKVKDLFVFFLH